MCSRPPLGKLSHFQLGQPSQRHREPRKAEAEIPAGWGLAEPPAPTCECTAAGGAAWAPRAGTHLRTPASAPAPAPQLPSGCEGPAWPRVRRRGCWRQAAPAPHLQPGQVALVDSAEHRDRGQQGRVSQRTRSLVGPVYLVTTNNPPEGLNRPRSTAKTD